MRQAGEPSVEEILESIKKVIARDNRTVATEARREREERGIAPSEARAAPSEGVLDLAALPQFDDTEYDDADFDEGEPAGDDAPETPLLNPASMTSMRDSLAALAMLDRKSVV